jgi:hypothetical protein
MVTENQFLKNFESIAMGSSKYITLDSLVIGTAYEVVNFRLKESTYGRCLVADLADGFWLVLPKRIGNAVETPEQVEQLNSKKYWMVFKGRNAQYRNMAIIEFKTYEQVILDQITSQIVLPPPLMADVNETESNMNMNVKLEEIKVEQVKPVKVKVSKISK